MTSQLTYAFLATFFISLFALVGVFAFGFREQTLKKLSFFLVAFSTGALLGGAFLHLLPEALNNFAEPESTFLLVLLGVILFYILERLLKWHHCHEDGPCETHTFTYMSLLGDSLHNFIDGLVIISAFSVSPEFGIATSLAVASHELPQELGDFGVLVHGGFSRFRALFWNFISGLSAIFGVIVGYLLIEKIENITPVFLALAAGGFIYVSMSDLIPELHKENKLLKSLTGFAIFALGLIFMYTTKIIFE